MSVVDNLNLINQYKGDIKQAIIDKGVDMTGTPLSGYAGKIGEIQTGSDPVTEELTVTNNGVFTPGEGVDGYSKVTVDVPQQVDGFSEKNITEGNVVIVNLNNSASFVAANAFIGKGTLQTVELPYCSRVYASAFYGCGNLKTVNLPSAQRLSGYAFAENPSLNTVNIPMVSDMNGDNIGYTFRRCYSLNNVNCNNLISVGGRGFIECSSLQSINIPCARNISDYAFASCSKLSEIYVGTSYYSVAIITNTVLNNTPFSKGIGSIYVPMSLVDAYKSATNWVSLSSMIYGVSTDDIFSFSNNTLYGTLGAYITGNDLRYLGLNSSSDLYTVSLPNVVYTDRETFKTYSKIQSVYLPNLAFVPVNVFNHCYALRDISMPNLKEVWGGGFASCSSLQNVYLPNVEKLIGGMNFAYCINLETISLPNLKIISGSNAFVGCSSLRSVDFPNCYEIGSYVFSKCTSLQTVNLPKLSIMGGYNFAFCSALESVYIGTENSQVVTLPENFWIFNGTPITNSEYLGHFGSIYVPMSLVDEYKTAPNWSNFKDRIVGI